MTNTVPMALKAAERDAIGHVRAVAALRRAEARAALGRMLAAAGRSPGVLDSIVSRITAHARLTFNFHPDRLLADGRSTAEALLEEGVYRSQFETRISNGSLTAYEGGLRDHWERALFGGAYHRDGVRPQDRPKYGALDVLGHPDGAAPRFGSCHLRLRRAVCERSTFTFGDSHLEPDHASTLDTLEVVLAPLFASVCEGGSALGLACDGAAELCGLIDERCDGSPRDAQGDPARSLDDYLEAQVHGPVRLAADAEALVADPSFRDTETGAHLAAIASRYDLRLHWHAGFTLPVARVPADFRGPEVVAIAAHVADLLGVTVLDAAVIGRAAASACAHPERWDVFGPPADVLQLLKKLWHVLVAFG